MTTAPDWAARVRDPRVPLHLRVVAWTATNCDTRGHARAYPGQLREAVQISGVRIRPSAISRAIRRAAQTGWLRDDSTAHHLVLAAITPPHPPTPHPLPQRTRP